MTKLTFEKLEILKEIAHLEKEMERFSKRTIIHILCHEIMESFHTIIPEDDKYWQKAKDALAYLIHAMEEKEKKNEK